MGERIKNIGLRYAIHLSDLCNWHLLTAVCFVCGHKGRLCMGQLKLCHPEHARLIDAEKRLRCGNRGNNNVYVAVAAPEPE